MKKELLDSYNPKSVDEIYEILGKIHNKDKAQLSNVVSHSFKFIKDNIRHGRHPSVLLHNLGSFETYITIINKKIRLYLLAYRGGYIKRKKQFDEKIRMLWGLRQIAIKNDLKEEDE